MFGDKKKERFGSLFKRKRQEDEPFSLYEPEMEFVTEDELRKEEEKKQETDRNSQRGSNPEDSQEKRSGKRPGIAWRFPFRKRQKGVEQEEISAKEASLSAPVQEDKWYRKIPRKKLAAIIGVVVVAVGAGVFFIVMNLGGSVEGTAYVESVKDIISLGSANGMNNRYTGEVEAQDSWKIELQSDLSVEECYVEEGDQVKEGDKLFSYNTEELKLARQRAELEVETLQNENSQLERDIKTYQSDLDSADTREKIELQTEILTAQTTIKKNEYSINSAKDEIDDLKKNIEDATVTSKMDGVVQSINAELGESSGVSDSDDEYSDYGYDTGSDGDGSAYMTILAVGDYRVKGTISETNVWSLMEGDPVIIRSRVDDTVQWTGSISQINTEETSDSEEDSYDDMDYTGDSGTGETASTYNFYVELDSDDGLMMGQHVFIEQDFGQDEEKEGIWLPSAYIYMDEDHYYVWRSNRRDRLELHEVTVGEYNEDLDEYQILEGLSEDDLIASDTGSLKENMKTTQDISEVEENTEAYYEEETSDDPVYYEDGETDESYDDSDEYYYDDGSYDDSDAYYDDGSDEDMLYDDVDLGDDVELIDEGFDPAEFE